MRFRLVLSGRSAARRDGTYGDAGDDTTGTGSSSGRPLRRDRQGERERRTPAGLALHPDPASVQLDELAGEREPETGALRFLLRGAHLAELLEDGLLVLRGDADAGIRH